MPTLETSFGPIAYASTGVGPPVVLLHANPGDRRDWDGVIESLAREHRVFALDWPGYGESAAPTPPERASATFFSEVLGEVLERLDVGPAILIGNSVGGFAAAEVALAQPARVAGLVLVDPGGFTTHTIFTRAFVRLKATRWFTRAFAGRFARRYLVRRTPWTAAMIARADEERSVPERVAVDAAVWGSFLGPRHDLRARARALQLPVLFIWGQQDPNVPLSRDGANARAALPTAGFVEVDTGHAPHAEDPDSFLAAVLPFLHEVTRTHGRTQSA